VDGLFSVPSVLLTRSLRQDRRTVSDLTVFAVSTTVTILMALNGFGAWSLAWGRLLGNLIGGIVIVVMTRTRLRFGFRRDVARHMITFGVPLTASSLLLFAMLNVDNIIVGRVLGTTALGFYVLAFNLSGWPVNTLSYTVRRVSLVGFSRLRGDPEAMRAGLVRTLGMLMAVTLIVCGLLATLADPLVRFVYGQKWSPAVDAVRYLAALGGARVMCDFLSDYLVAVGKPRTILLLQATWVAALIPLLAVGAHVDGIYGVSFAHMAVALILVVPAFLFAVRRTGVRLMPLLTVLWRPVLGSVLGLAGAAVAISRISGPFARLAIGATIAAAVYAAIVYPARLVFTRAIRSPLPAEEPT